MEFKTLMGGLELGVLGTVALLLFFCTFVGIVIWTFTRPRQEIEAQSRLWEDDEDKRRAAGGEEAV
jgi:cbb3-type cytochrome oxidase subunit 3